MTDIRNFINTTGAEELRDAMHGSREWVQRQNVQPSPTRTNKLVSAFVVFLVVFGIVVGMVAAGRAAERGDHMRPHEMTLVLPLPPADGPVPDVPYVLTISGTYPDHAACVKATKRVTIKAPGAKIVCSIVNPFRVR